MTLTVSVNEIVESSKNPLLAIRPGWKRVRLGQIASIQNGFAFKSAQFTKDGGVPLIRIRDVGSDTTDTHYVGEFDERYLVEPGDLLIGMDGDFNCARWKGPRALLNQRVCKVSLQNGEYHPRFLDYALPAYLKVINDATSSVTVKHLSSRSVEEIPLPFPSLAEQEEIVAEIEKQFSRLDEAVANLKRVKTKLERYRAVVLRGAVEGRLVVTEAELARRKGGSYETGAQLLQRILEARRGHWEKKLRYKEPLAVELADLPELPDGWAWATLDSIAALKGGITVDQKRKDPTGQSVPYLRVANVQRGYLDLAEVKCIEAPAADIEELRLQPGDVLFNEGGDRDKLGRGWIWEGQLRECIHQNHVFRARLFLAEMSPKLLSWWGNTFGKEYFLREGKQTTNLASINLTKLREFPVPVPPAAEQSRIVSEVDRRLSLIDDLRTQVEANLRRADQFRQAILRNAFSGQLPSELEPITRKAEMLRPAKA
jgi:type I restriction enzyme S subunit